MKIGPHQSINQTRREEQPTGQHSRQSASVGSPGSELEAGRMLKGKVLSLAGSGRYLIETSSGTFTAKTPINLEVGKEFWFEVVKGGQNPLLSIAAKQGAASEILRLLFPGMPALNELAAVLTNQSPASTDGKMLAEVEKILNMLVQNSSGPDAEPEKIIKLLSWLNQGSTAGRLEGKTPSASLLHSNLPATGDLNALAESLSLPGLQKLARLFDAHSLLNSQLPQTSGLDQDAYLMFPAFFAGDSGWGEWLFSFDAQDQSNEKKDLSSYNLAFYLNMTRLGDVHLDLKMRQKNLEGVFSLAGESEAEHLRGVLPELTTALEGMYQSVILSCRSAPKTSLQQLKDDLAAKSGQESFVLVDVKA